MAVGGALRDEFVGDVGAGARLVLDEYRLADQLREPGFGLRHIHAGHAR
jgi:hypothetical protein